MGPNEVDTVYDNGSVRIKTIDENQTSLVVNGHRLTSEMQLISKRVSPPIDLP
jgi:hypothetical protein